MTITRNQLITELENADPSKLVCFCGDPRGLSFYRIKGRGTVLQLEFNEQIYRTREGRLVIEHLGMGTGEPEENAYTVGGLILGLRGGPDLPMQFGGSSDALSFTGTSETGEWVSIEFEQRVTRGENDALRVDETRDGQSITKEFAASATHDPSA
jgi:hypothetical protein